MNDIAVAQPNYRPDELTVGIAHIGVGNFHRSHEAMYVDRLLNSGDATEWAICGIGLLPSDARMRDALRAQGMQYTLVERAPDGAAPARSIASIVEFLHAPDDPEAVFELLAAPTTRIVSLTITEGGYNINDATGEFNADNPGVVTDLARTAPFATVFGVVVEGLRRRRDRGIPPFTVMSCDNLPGNGHIARESFIAFAELLDPELAAWIRDSVEFPNSMVDRITPVTTDDDRAFIRDQFGVEDAWPVVSEDFVQWVLEDRFTVGRPPLEQVGVQVVPDVLPYEHMKLRLLNAGHQAIAYFGYLLGYRSVSDAATDPLIAALLTRYFEDEAESTLEPLPGVDVREYERTLIARFSNPYIKDTLLRLGTDASDRIPKFLLPVVLDRSARGEASPMAAGVVASWAAFARGIDEHGAPIEFGDRQRALIDAAVRRQESDPIGFLKTPEVFGALAEDGAFASAFADTYRTIRDLGARAALERLLATN